MKKTLLAISLFVAFTGFAVERGFASDCSGYRMGLNALTRTIQTDPEHQEEAREGIRELRQMAADAGCRIDADQGAVKRALAECQWEVRQMAMSRQRSAFAGIGGFNDPNMGMAAANLAAIAASAPPGPAVMDECMAAKGF